MQLITCSACGEHHRVGECRCPHCGAAHACARPKRTAAAAALGLVLLAEGCMFVGEPKYGVVMTDTGGDEDHDGWTVDDGDCDDEDATVFPGAPETADDGVDSNCDGDDNT
jgi:hypothetical protein